MAIDVEISERLRRARIASGFESAADAADNMDISYPTYAGHENGSGGISLKSLRRYARFFRVNLLWLADGKGPMRGGGGYEYDPFDGLSPEGRKQALEYIEFLKSKSGG